MTSPEPTSNQAGGGGGRPTVARRRTVVIIAASVVFVLLCVAALFGGAARGSSQRAATTATPSAASSAVPPSRVVPDTIPAPTALRTCTIATAVKDPRLATFSGDVMDVDSGEVLFSRDGKEPVATASVFKLLTASAALKVLGPDYSLTTAVVAGAEPGTIVLVGGGDPTLSRTPLGTDSVYPDAPKLADLASLVQQAMGGTPITKIVLDSSFWNPKDDWDSSWKRSNQTIGYQSEVTALQVDGDRTTPTKAVSPRSSDPVMAAGVAFAAALGVPAVALEKGTAPADAQELASVQSQPLSSLIHTMLISSDGSLAESIARVTSKVSGADGSSASLQKVITTALKTYGLDTDGVVIRDGSGLSAKDAVSPRFVNKLLIKLRGGDNNLDVVYDGLSVAGETGGLESRFSGRNAVARGHVTGKVGHIDALYSLAGIVDAVDGAQLAFTFTASGGSVGESAKVALDTVATAIYQCGANLSNH